jgi:hypothetical protein
MSLFCAAWTVASFKYLAEAGADGVTFFETAGGNGLMDAPGAPPRPGFHAVVGGVFPVWHVLADLGEFRGGAVVPSTSSHPLAVDCLALRLERRTRVLLANLTPEVQIVRLPGSARVRTLDAGNAEEAMGRPERFRGSARDAALSRGLPLEPYAVATLDLGAPAPAKEKQRR